MEKTKLCPKCSKEKSVFGFHQHVKYCKGTPKPPKSVPEVKAEPLNVEAEPLPEKIVIQQDYAPVPKLEIESQITEEPEPEKPPEPKEEEPKPQTPDESEKVNFEGMEDVVIGIINKRLKNKDIEELTSEEQERIRKAWNTFCEKRLQLFLKYADLLNLGFALVFPLVTRAPLLAAKKEQQAKEVPAVEAKAAVRLDSEAERAKQEFEELTRK